MNPLVALAPIATYEARTLDQTVDQLFTVAGNASGIGRHVLIKPNLISARNGQLACSEPALLFSVARWFLDQGAKVQIGDSPAFGSSSGTLQAIGATDGLDRLGVEIIEFTRVKEVRSPSGHRIPLAAAALECDLLVNVPRVKAHAQTRVTMSVKNLFGCLKGLRKGWWHMAYGGKNERFTHLVGQLPAVLPHSIHLLDGIKAMHVTGPINGIATYPGVLGCSTDAFALDTAFLHVLGVDPDSCPLWKTASREGNTGTDRKNIVWPLHTPESFSVDEFIVPAELMPIRFNPCRFIKSSMRRVLLPLMGQ